MPELPEVETVAQGAHQRAHGQRIAGAWFGPHLKLCKNPPAEQAEGLEGRRIDSIHRSGKHIVFELSPRRGRKGPGAQWIVHLGMTGRLLVTAPEAPLARHTHARLELSGGQEIRFVDPRRFGKLEFRDLATAEPFTPAGAEPLTISRSEFALLFARRKLSIKAALLNQSLLSGVGNIYADESLFRAGLLPTRAAATLSAEELERLRQALRRVLKEAIALGGSSVSDYVDASGAQGFFQLEHRVYRRTGQPCRSCGAPIERVVSGGRSTHYCPRCQR